MAAKLVNLGFGFGPPRNPRSGPPWVSRAERRARGRESKGGEARRGEKGGEAATASAAAVELLTSIHHCVTKNELEREREEREEAASYIQDVHFSLCCCEKSNASIERSRAEVNFSNQVDRSATTDVSIGMGRRR